MAEEEVQALQGIFCGEFEILSNSGDEWTLCICVSCQLTEGDVDQSYHSFKISLQCFLPIGYPNELPTISLACESLTKHSANQLRDELHEYAKTLIGQPMIMELVYWVQENARRFIAVTSVKKAEKSTLNQEDSCKPYVAVLHIDHMRSRARYIKTLVSWAAELSLHGRLLFAHNLILVMLFGNEDNIKDFLVRLRTQKVDVDSNGRGCKERMMSVLMQGSHPSPTDEKRTMGDFQVCECSTTSELESVFTGAGLKEIYSGTVVPKFNLLQISASKALGKR